MTQRTPSSATRAAARTLVAMPPVPTRCTLPPASASISGVTASTWLISFASGILARVGGVEALHVGEDDQRLGLDDSPTTRPASVSLSPNLSSSTDTVSFSLMIGTTPSSRAARARASR